MNMAASKPFLYASFLSLMSSCLSLKQDAAINFNTASKEYPMKISQGKNTFLELISKGIFVDKTLLIDAFVNHTEEYLAIARPPGWGKTINLDMLRMFFEIPLHPNGTRILPISSTPNYRLFKEGKYYSNGYNITLQSPLLISQPEYSHLIEEHLGQYPVIHWSFDDLPFANDTNEEAIVAEINEKVYDQHRYLSTKNDWRYSSDDISTLISRLNDYFKKKAFVLIDGYDRFSKKIKGSRKIDFLLKCCTQCNNYYKNKQKAILTGTEEGNLDLLEHSKLLKNIKSFQHLYGFTITEMSLIYNHYSITEQEQNRIQYWYGGYKLNQCWYPDTDIDDIFHPSAICSYLNTYKYEYYSLHKIYTTYMNELMKLETSLYIFTRSMNGDGKYSCLCLHNITILPCKTPRELKSLFYGGYFSRYEWYSGFLEIRFMYKIPNFQTANHLRSILASNCTKLFDRSWSTLLTETCLVWDWFLLSDEATSYKLQSNMDKCYKLMSTYYEKITRYNYGYPISNSVTVQVSALISIMPSKKLHFLGWHYQSFPRDMPDNLPDTKILLSSGARGIFISVREDEDEIDSVVNQSSRYTQILKPYAEFHGWKDIKFVDCKLLPYNKLEIHATVRPLNRT